MSRHIGDDSQDVSWGTLGPMEEFDGRKDCDWQQYVGRLEHFDDAAKKRAVFLSVIGATA